MAAEGAVGKLILSQGRILNFVDFWPLFASLMLLYDYPFNKCTGFILSLELLKIFILITPSNFSNFTAFVVYFLTLFQSLFYDTFPHLISFHGRGNKIPNCGR